MVACIRFEPIYDDDISFAGTVWRAATALYNDIPKQPVVFKAELAKVANYFSWDIKDWTSGTSTDIVRPQGSRGLTADAFIVGLARIIPETFTLARLYQESLPVGLERQLNGDDD